VTAAADTDCAPAAAPTGIDHGPRATTTAQLKRAQQARHDAERQACQLAKR
jgi:hypothetical protein